MATRSTSCWMTTRRASSGSGRAVLAAAPLTPPSREWAGTSKRQDATARMDALRGLAHGTDRTDRSEREGRKQRLP